MKKHRPPRRRSGAGYPASSRKAARPRKQNHPPVAEVEILSLLYRQNNPLSLAKIARAMNLDSEHRHGLDTRLRDLCRRGLLECLPKKQFRLSPHARLVEGRVEMHPRGFGFAVIPREKPAQESGSDPDRTADPFISPKNLGSAHHGDKALFLRVPGRRSGRDEARVIRIIERRTETLVGTFLAGRTTGLVHPEDERYPFKVLVRKTDSSGAKNGQAVLVKIMEILPGRRNPTGRIVEILGDPSDISVQNEMVIRKHGLSHSFPAETLSEAAALSSEVSAADRLDLRHLPHVTIDGETARDFDDAVAVEKTDQGWRLHVSIADVSCYVRPGTPLDREAYRRGTSVYFPSRVLPMLPERLSNDLCSLVPGQDRLAFTAVLDFDRRGKRRGKRFARSIIKSRHRLTYTIVKQIVADRDLNLRKRYQDVTSQLTEMAGLAAVLEQRRMARGSIGFSNPEAAIEVSETGEIRSLTRAERNLAHKLIEEFMLAANEAVAEHLADHGTPTLFRIHEKPDSQKVEEFVDFARTLGLVIPDDGGSPAWFGRILNQVSGGSLEYIVNNLLLRTMQRARYSPHNVGHFGLAASHYTHFTSPIRRYPDLLVHRALAATLERKKPARVAGGLEETGDFLSAREQTAVEAERDMADLLKVRYMADKIGRTYAGVISGVTSFGLFIELLDIFVSGAVPMNNLRDDYYRLDDKNHRLIGSTTNTIYRLGDQVLVQVESVDERRRHIDFSLSREILVPDHRS